MDRDIILQKRWFNKRKTVKDTGVGSFEHAVLNLILAVRLSSKTFVIFIAKFLEKVKFKWLVNLI